MSGNRENYNRRKNGGSSKASGSKSPKGKGFFKGLAGKVNFDKVKDNLKPVEHRGHSDVDEIEYFGGKVSREPEHRPEPRSEHRREHRPEHHYEKDYRDYRQPRSRSDYHHSEPAPSRKPRREKADMAAKFKGGFDAVGGEVKKRVNSNRPAKSGNRKKSPKKSRVAIPVKIPGILAIISCLLIVTGVVVAMVPGSTTASPTPTATVESAFPTQTYTYEDGLATMGLVDETEAATTGNYLVPLKPKEYDPIIYSYPPAGKRVALTFDDGPSKEMTDDYIKVLADNNVKATFFLLAKNVKAFPDEAKLLADAGHDIASHSLKHAQLSSLSTSALQNDFKKSNEIFKEVFGKTPAYMRPPYGSYNDEVLSTARNYGQIPIYWSIDTNDWRKCSTETMINTIKSEISDGAIILMHEGKCNTLEALPTMISTLRDMGYEIVPLSQLLSY